ncbi:MAG: sensor domain-containing phosphodiesterase [Nitrospirota bacterium]|jgi:diguanylate cyclase (GGDEF)-like protein
MAVIDYAFDGYMRLLRPALPMGSEMAVLDEEGRPVWFDGTGDAERMRATLARVGREYWVEGGAGGLDLQRCTFANGGTLYHLALHGPEGATFGYLTVVVVDGDHAVVDLRDDAAFCRAFVAAAACICREHGLNLELNAMAEELGARYEELNLLYSVHERAKERGGADRTFVEIVEDCARHMDVPWVSIVVPDRNVDVHHSSANGVRREWRTTWKRAVDEVMAWLVTHKRGLVVNGAECEPGIEVARGLSCKFIATPIFDDLGEVCGVVCVGRHLETDDFRNSDRVLVEVIARRVTEALGETFDSLTGLFTRQGFERAVAPVIDTADDAATDTCLIYLGVDETSLSASRKNAAAGAVILKEIGHTVRGNLRVDDRIARVSDFAFAALLEKCPIDRAYGVAEKLKEAISQHSFVVEGARFDVSLAIGIAELRASTGSIDVLLRSAELAAEVAEERGESRVLAYDPEDDDIKRREAAAETVNLVRRALREDRFELWAQPIVGLAHGLTETHLEVLLRLRDDDGRLLAPGHFLPAAEIYHLMPAIDRWVIKHALVVVERHLASATKRNFHVAINLAGQSFRDTSLLGFILDELSKRNVPAERLCFEVTETTAMGQVYEARAFMDRLKEHGCLFSLDDFGSGLSSFSYLKNLPVDFLKIDMEFVAEILDDPVSAVIVDAVNRVGHAMGLRTIAEGVENDEVKGRLKEMGIDYVQGYGIAMPRPLGEVLRELRDGHDEEPSPPGHRGAVAAVQRA